MGAGVNIPIAGFKDVYHVGVVEQTLAELPSSANESLRTTYEKMLRAGARAGAWIETRVGASWYEPDRVSPPARGRGLKRW